MRARCSRAENRQPNRQWGMSRSTTIWTVEINIKKKKKKQINHSRTQHPWKSTDPPINPLVTPRSSYPGSTRFKKDAVPRILLYSCICLVGGEEGSESKGPRTAGPQGAPLVTLLFFYSPNHIYIYIYIYLEEYMEVRWALHISPESAKHRTASIPITLTDLAWHLFFWKFLPPFCLACDPPVVHDTPLGPLLLIYLLKGSNSTEEYHRL